MQWLRAALKGDRAATLDRAALDLAAIEYPGLDLDPSLAKLDAMAGELGRRAGAGVGGAAYVREANRLLCEELGYAGNQSDYYNPSNSCLNHVLETRAGLPITLCAIYIEVARRLRRPVFGVGLPGHFIVEYDDDEYKTFIDPFHGGKLLTGRECSQVAREIAGVEIAAEAAALRPVTTRYILVRMLHNLRAAYFRAGNFVKVVEVLTLLIEDDPAAAANYRTRGVARLRLRQFLAARSDFEMYLRREPEAEDRAAITKQLEAIHRWLAAVN